MIKLTNILSEQGGDEQPLQLTIIAPEAYETHMAWTRFLQRNKKLSVTKHTYPSDELFAAAKQISAESDGIDVAIVQLIANKEPLNSQIKSVQALKQVCERKGIRLIVLGPETESFTDGSDRKYQQLMRWLAAANITIIDISDLTDTAYYDTDTKDLNAIGNKVIMRRVMRILKQIEPELESEDPTDAEKKAAGQVKPVGKIEDDQFAIAKNGVLVIPDVNQVRTGETTDWEAVMDFYVDKGLSVAGAAAMAGNFKVESNFKPDVYGDHGTSVGLAQWHNTRMKGLFDFAQAKGLEPYSVETQLEWSWKELNGSWKSLLNYLKTATDARKAAYEVASKYEMPAVISRARMDYAEKYANEYDSSVMNQLSDLGSQGVSSLTAAAAGIAGVSSYFSNSPKAPTVNAKNGRLSASDLKQVAPGHFLAPEAADAYLEMKADYEAENVDAKTGKPTHTFKLSDSYRPYSVQYNKFDWNLYHKTGKMKKINTNGNIAMAYPGTSNHGWGKAIDLWPKHAQDWVRENGKKYGWSWDEGKAAGEAWHFTYVK